MGSHVLKIRSHMHLNIYHYSMYYFVNRRLGLFIARHNFNSLSALVALLFPEKKDSAFANYHTWKAIGFTITFVYGNFLCVSTKLLIAICLLVVSMLLYVIVEIRVRRTSSHTASEEEKRLDPTSKA